MNFLNKKEMRSLMDLPNVVAVGYGFKMVDGVRTRVGSIVVSVTRKIRKSWLPKSAMIPSIVHGLQTDVIETGEIKALALTDKHRPAFGGVSIGHKDVTAGTFGCVVKKDQRRYILSNNHVLANSNKADVGDPIYQPGPHDGGTAEDQIAVLDDYVPIILSEGLPDCPIPEFIARFYNAISLMFDRSHRLRAYKTFEGANLVDAALAGPITRDDATDLIYEIGLPGGTRKAELGDQIQKTGRTTGHKVDEVTQIGVTVNVQYGEGKMATFEDQIMAGPMSAGGDSGSVVLDMNLNLVGLLFAGSEDVTIINNIGNVFEALNVTLP